MENLRQALISRRTLLRGVVAGVLAAPLSQGTLDAVPGNEVLYNGITLGRPWPPRLRFLDEHPVTPPYLANPPAVIPIDVGRQLFVDDFLIEETTLERTWHTPAYHPASPILKPDRPWERRDDYADRTGTPPSPSATVFSDGVFFDPQDHLFKMWYMGGYGRATCLATSQDGLTWDKPLFNVVPGTNIVDLRHRDSSVVWLDPFETDNRRRFKMSLWRDRNLVLLVSADGIHWTTLGESGPAGDRSTFFYNPFRRMWVFSLRADENTGPVTGRYRTYWESPTFAPAPNWNGMPPVAWIKADSRDYAAPGMRTAPELYNLDAVAYESVLLGLFAIWRGESDTREKINEVTVGFSRDGFHWQRADRRPFLPVSERPGSWNWANVQSAGGGCLIVGDELYFYASGRAGIPGTPAPGVCSTGLALLRRDGFASMDWLPSDPAFIRRRAPDPDGQLTTRSLQFRGGHLFVNADLGRGELRVEVLDSDSRVIMPFARDASVPITGNGTKLAVRWTSGTLGGLAGQPLRFRFWLTSGRLYAFWVSPWATGESEGYTAGGGPGFRRPTDTRQA